MANEILRPRFAFIPKPLEIEGKPEFSKFPFNIMFGCGWDMRAHAIYTPDLKSFISLPEVIGMTYYNEHDLHAKVVVEHYPTKGSWGGSKYFESERVGTAMGKDWRIFFIHLTALGCDQRESVQIH